MEEPSPPRTEIESLRARLAEAEAVLEGIRKGEVDALVVEDARGQQVFTLGGADRIYRQIVQGMSEGAATVAPDGLILSANARLGQMLEVAQEETIGKPLRDFLGPADSGLLDMILAADPAVPMRREVTLLGARGRRMPANLSASALDIDGLARIHCLVITDLTEQRERQEQVIRAERLARLILEQSTECIVVCDAQEQVIRLSHAAERLCSGQALLARFDSAFPLEAANGEAFCIASVLQGRTLRDVEVVVHGHGRRFELLASAAPLHVGAEIVGCVVTLFDITERKSSVAALAASEGKLRAIFDAVGDGILLAEADSGQLSSGNRALCRMLGYPSDELAALSLRDLVPDELQAAGRGARLPGADIVLEPDLQVRRKDGTVLFADVNWAELSLGGRVLCLGIFRDATERRRSEAALRTANEQLRAAHEQLLKSQHALLQQERLRALIQMAAGLAHDINNAISPAALYVESLLASDGGMDTEALRKLRAVRASIEDVASTVARLREFYRPREPRKGWEPVDIKAVAREAAETTRPRWHDMPMETGMQIDLRLDLPDDLPPVLGAADELRAALINLIFNAVDAMPRGGTITVRAVLEQQPRGPDGHDRVPRVMLEVADTGIGMDAATQRHCLEPFFTTKGERGTGLGLAMVYGVAQRHGALLHIDSEQGRGTTVTLSLLRAGSGAEWHPQEVPVLPVPPLRLLLVDDDPVLLRSLQEVLEGDGHVVVTAGDGQSAIESFAPDGAAPFDAVITDLGMPNITGRQVARHVKRIAPATPVILLTGWGRRLIDDGSRQPDVDRVLSKPPRLAQLRAALAQLCGTPLRRGRVEEGK